MDEVEVEFFIEFTTSLGSRVGGGFGGWGLGLDFTRLMLISTQVEVVVRSGRNNSLYCILIISFLVLQFNFKLPGKNEKHIVKVFFIRGLQSSIKEKVASSVRQSHLGW